MSEQRAECLALSFQVISRRGGNEVSKDDFLQVLKHVRPHYGENKIQALWDTHLAVKGGAKSISKSTYISNMPAVMATPIHRWRPPTVRDKVYKFVSFFRRSLKTLPGIVPPMLLLFSTIHVLCYVGMLIWAGSVSDEQSGRGGNDFYYLNNFNSYSEGLVVLFNILVVNDWHQIALVFTHKHVGPEWIAYTYFIGVNLFVVNVMLQVLTAFFINLFFLEQEDEGVCTQGSKVAPEREAGAEGESETLLIHEKRRNLFSDLDTMLSPRSSFSFDGDGFEESRESLLKVENDELRMRVKQLQNQLRMAETLPAL